MADGDIQAVLAEYAEFAGRAPVRATLATDGLSGAAVWRVSLSGSHLCVRRWPGPADSHRLARIQWIHKVVSGTAAAGFDRLAVPHATRTKDTCVLYDGHIWEVAPWLPGTADSGAAQASADLATRRLTAALDALARFHVAAARVEHPASPIQSPGLLARTKQLESLLSDEFRRWRAIVQRAAGHTTALGELTLPLARRWCELFPRVAARVAKEMERVGAVRVPLQPCLRDIHREHVLFERDEVTGLVDYDAMRTDSVIGDVARLLESYAGADLDRWRQGIDAYSRTRPLSSDELKLLPAFDASTVLLSSANWIDWLYVQRIDFERHERVRARLAHWLERLESLAITPLFPDDR